MKKEQTLGIIRHTLTFLGGLLIMKGIVDEALVSEITGGIMTVIGGVWSILDKGESVK